MDLINLRNEGGTALGRWGLRLAAAALPALAFLCLAPPASATAPGINGKIAFVAYDPPWEPYAGVPAAIKLMNADGTGQAAIASGFKPSFSGDGRRIAFDGQHGGLWVMNADGSNQTKLLDGGYCGSNCDDAFNPSFSFDGRRIAYQSGQTVAGSTVWYPDPHVFVINADGTNQVDLGPGGDPAFSPDDGRIAFVQQGDLWVMSVDGTNRKRLTSNCVSACQSVTTIDSEPSFSPDGKKIAFTRTTYRCSGFPPGCPGVSTIYVISANGGVPTLLARGWEPAFSPDGKKVAFARYVQRPDSTVESDVFVVDSSGTNERQLTTAANGQPDWQPLPLPGKISGKVTSTTGAAIASASVECGPGGRANTSLTGDYTIANVTSGTYSCTAAKTGYTPQSQSVTVQPGATTSANFKLPPPGKINGKVKATTGAAIASATVDCGAGGKANSSLTGDYTISNVMAGTYTCTASKTGYASANQNVTVQPGATTAANFTLAKQ